MQKKKKNAEGFFCASDDGFIHVQTTYKVKSFLFTARDRKIIQMTELDISASVNHLGIRPLTSA